MSFSNLKAGNIVNFNVKTTVIKSNFTGVTVEGLVSAAIAQQIKDVKSMHLQVKPYITGIPDNFDDYTYVIIRLGSGQRDVIGLPWITESTVSISLRKKYKLILDDVEPDQVEIIRNALVNRGVSIESFTEYS